MALLSDCFLPRLGGIEVQVHDLALNLQRAGHEVEVFTITPPRDNAHGQMENLRVTRYASSVPMPSSWLINPAAVRPLRRALQRGDFDVAHVHIGVVSPFSMDAVRVAMDLGIPVAATWHCVIHKAAPLLAAMGYVKRWGERAVALSAVSGFAASQLQPLAGDSVVHVLPNGIDADFWSPAGRIIDHPGGADDDSVLRVVSAMRLMPRKRPVELVEIVAEARRLAPDQDIRLELLGEGPLRPEVEAQIRRAGGQDWCTLPGRKSRPELRDRYLASSVYAAPTRLEAFGIAALEARTTGLPVVSFRGSGTAQFVVDGENGLLAGDDAGLSSAIARLAIEPELRRKITQHNVTVPPRESWPQVVQEAIAEYHRAGALMGV